MPNQSLDKKCRNAIFKIARTVKEINQGVKELDAKIEHLIDIYHSTQYKKPYDPFYNLNGQYKE